MEFEWDEIKREENLNRDEGGKPRGIDFVDVIPLFSDERSICVEDTRKDYGERRFNLYGYAMDNNLYKVTFTRRSHRIRIISARRTNKRERRHYEQEKGRELDTGHSH